MSGDVRLPAKGSLVRDTMTDKVGVVMDIQAPNVLWLRARGGGTEWTVDADKVQPYRTSDELAERVRAERKGRYYPR